MTESGLEKLFAAAVTLAMAEIVKVGPKGYIHGWIKVGEGETAAHAIEHHEHGHVGADSIEHAVSNLKSGETYHHADVSVSHEKAGYRVHGGAGAYDKVHPSPEAAARDLNTRHEKDTASLKPVLDMLPEGEAKDALRKKVHPTGRVSRETVARHEYDGIGEADDAGDVPVPSSGRMPDKTPSSTAKPSASGSITDDEETAAKAYFGMGYRDINEKLRYPGDFSLDPDSIFSNERELDQTISRLDSLIAKSVVNEDTTVYRGMTELPDGYLSPGDVLEDDAFMSTTPDQKIAGGFGGYVFKIKVPAGSHGYAPGTREDELLLSRGKSIKVTAVNGKQIEGELIDRG